MVLCGMKSIEMMKMALFVTVSTEDGAFVLFLGSHPQEFATQGKKNC